ncbi:unnamed protein product [Cladocopium goreaui]|uniref:Uncharacterized protein n=1 Tax=Cladocopium goreaui TaxID=2562237 RepID=A0A9P1C0G8_9DINO|nr:unnamed protein product [Cladocopium goreaui]
MLTDALRQLLPASATVPLKKSHEAKLHSRETVLGDNLPRPRLPKSLRQLYGNSADAESRAMAFFHRVNEVNFADPGDTLPETDALTFFEEKLLSPIQHIVRIFTLHDKRHVVVPSIDTIGADDRGLGDWSVDVKDLEYRLGGGLGVLGFSWTLGQAQNDPYQADTGHDGTVPAKSPVMAGGLFASDTREFLRLGGSKH